MPEVTIRYDRLVRRPNKQVLIIGDKYVAIPLGVVLKFVEEDPYPDLLDDHDLAAIRSESDREIEVIPNPGENPDELVDAMEEAGIRLRTPSKDLPYRAGDDCTEDGSIMTDKQIALANKITKLYVANPTDPRVTRVMADVVEHGTKFTIPAMLKVKDRLHPTYLQSLVNALVRKAPKPSRGADFIGAAVGALLPERRPEHLGADAFPVPVESPTAIVEDTMAEQQAILAAASRSAGADLDSALSILDSEIRSKF